MPLTVSTARAGQSFVNGSKKLAGLFSDLAPSPNALLQNTNFALIFAPGRSGGLFTFDGNSLAVGSRFTFGTRHWEIDYGRTSATPVATSNRMPTAI